jgi:hypothetical protein
MNVFVTADRRISIALDEIIGSYRTFGPVGPGYDVLGVVEPASGPDVMLEIRVNESGETLRYPLTQAVADPLAR